MVKEETQIDIINRLLPGSKLTKTEEYIVDKISSLDEEDKIVYIGYPLTEEAKNCLLQEAHPYISNLLKKLEAKKRFTFGTFADWYDLKAVSYEIVAQYIEGKSAYQVLHHNLIKTGETTEEEMQQLATRKSKRLKVLLKSGMELDTMLPLEEKLELYQSLNIISKMQQLEMVSGYNTNQTLENIGIYGGAMLYAEWYYKHQDEYIEDYIKDVIKEEINYRQQNKSLNNQTKVLIKMEENKA